MGRRGYPLLPSLVLLNRIRQVFFDDRIVEFLTKARQFRGFEVAVFRLIVIFAQIDNVLFQSYRVMLMDYEVGNCRFDM